MFSVIYTAQEENVKQKKAVSEFMHFGNLCLKELLMLESPKPHTNVPVYAWDDSLPSNLVMIVEGDPDKLDRNRKRVSSAFVPEARSARTCQSFDLLGDYGAYRSSEHA